MSDFEKVAAPALFNNSKDFLFVVPTCVAGSIEAIPLFTLVVGTYFSHNYSSFNIGSAGLVFFAAFSMGIQHTCAKQVNRIGVVTALVTGTLSSLVSFCIGAQTKHQLRHPAVTLFCLVLFLL
jgi:uncharacterized membrane protein YoaK (UPF0700 family)